MVNWEHNGTEIKEETRKKYPELGENLGWKISNEQYYFRESLTWTFISSNCFGIRYSKPGALFDVGGSSIFAEKDIILYLLGYLTSKVAFGFLRLQNPTLNFQVVNIASLPIKIVSEVKSTIEKYVNNSIKISEIDWDSFETSWDFVKHPFIESLELRVQSEAGKNLTLNPKFSTLIKLA